MTYLLSKLIVPAYAGSAIVAVVSNAVVAAAVAGAFGLAGITLQLVIGSRQARMERQVEANRSHMDRTAGRVLVNDALLDERGREIERLSRRVEQLVAILVQQGRVLPDERRADVGPPDGERRR